MAGPITWRNVSPTINGGGGSIAASGANMIQQGLQNLQQLAAQQQALQIQNQKALRDSNTQDYLDQVAAVTDPTKLADPTVQANLAALRSSYGGLIDRAATRDAVAGQLSQLQSQAIKSDQFQDEQQERNQRPLEEQLLTAARNNDKSTVNQILNDNSLLNEGKLGQQADAILDANTNRTYAAAGQARAQAAEGRAERGEQRAIAADGRAATMFNLNVENLKDEHQFRDQQRALAQADQQTKRGLAVLQQQADTLDLNKQLLDKTSPAGQQSTDPDKDALTIMTQLGGGVDPWLGRNNISREEMAEKLRNYMANGIQTQDANGNSVNIKVTPAQLQQFAMIHKDDTRIMDTLPGDLDTYFREMYARNPELLENTVKAQQAQDAIRTAQGQLSQQKTQLLKNSLNSYDRILQNAGAKPTQTSKNQPSTREQIQEMLNHLQEPVNMPNSKF